MTLGNIVRGTDAAAICNVVGLLRSRLNYGRLSELVLLIKRHEAKLILGSVRTLAPAWSVSSHFRIEVIFERVNRHNDAFTIAFSLYRLFV